MNSVLESEPMMNEQVQQIKTENEQLRIALSEKRCGSCGYGFSVNPKFNEEYPGCPSEQHKRNYLLLKPIEESNEN